MYRTCILCHKPLGTNEVIESFPVGRRLAFNAARGRLWVGGLVAGAAAWKEAEEIAEISDNLFLPECTEDFLREHGGEVNHGGAGTGSLPPGGGPLICVG